MSGGMLSVAARPTMRWGDDPKRGVVCYQCGGTTLKRGGMLSAWWDAKTLKARGGSESVRRDDPKEGWYAISD